MQDEHRADVTGRVNPRLVQVGPVQGVCEARVGSEKGGIVNRQHWDVRSVIGRRRARECVVVRYVAKRGICDIEQSGRQSLSASGTSSSTATPWRRSTARTSASDYHTRWKTDACMKEQGECRAYQAKYLYRRDTDTNLDAEFCVAQRRIVRKLVEHALDLVVVKREAVNGHRRTRGLGLLARANF
jgi:hypothetical protein